MKPVSSESTDLSAEPLLEREQEIDELVQHIEEFVREETEERRYFSTDVYAMGEHKVTLDIYGTGDYPMPDKRTVANAVGDFYSWTAGFEEDRSEKDRYSIKVIDLDSTEPV